MTDSDKWKAKLTPKQYAVLREKGTEVPFTGKLLNNKDTGLYVCAACHAELFDSETKFNSGTGWPSFSDVKSSRTITLIDDDTASMHRAEVQCSNCGGHLGHLFLDGPGPTGQRYCINSVALDFKKKS